MEGIYYPNLTWGLPLCGDEEGALWVSERKKKIKTILRQWHRYWHGTGDMGRAVVEKG
jgi:hypothetical protein